MKAILVIDLNDDVNLEDVEISYVIQDKYGMPVKAEVDGCPLKPMPQPREMTNADSSNPWIDENAIGFNECLAEILGEEE